MQNTKLSGQPIFCQLLSYVPKHVFDKVVAENESDYYYKTMTTYKQFVFLMYGIIAKVNSLNSLCKCLLFLEGKLSYLNIKELPAKSTLSDANRKRDSKVFQDLYYALFDYYRPQIENRFHFLPLNGEADCSKIKRFDSTTFTLFSTVFKGAGRDKSDGSAKKGGIKAQTVLALDSLVPEFIDLNHASKNDKDFLGQLKTKKGYTYVFDKGYVNYSVYQKWSEEEVFFVTRINKNATYKVLERQDVDILDLKSLQGVIKDEVIEVSVNATKSSCKLRLITYIDPHSNKRLQFLTNHFEYDAFTIALIYKNRWAIEPFFKQLKQNYLLNIFFSDSEYGIQTQIWIALICNLIFTIIYQQTKQAEQFTTIVTMAKTNLGSYISLITIITSTKIEPILRKNEIVQLDLFRKMEGGVFEKQKLSP